MTTDEDRLRARVNKLRRSLPKADRKRVALRPRIGVRSLGQRLVRKLAWGLVVVILFAVVLPPFFWPVVAPTSSGFFLRFKPDSPTLSWEIHRGIDLAAPAGTSVATSALGVVTAAGHNTELGNFVQVGHLAGFSTLYGHLQRIDVKQGDLVLPGFSRLGLVGSTGRSTGPHLHLGVFLLGLPLPPDLFLVFHSLRRAAMGF